MSQATRHLEESFRQVAPSLMLDVLLFLGGKRVAGNPTGSDLVREAPRAKLVGGVARYEGQVFEVVGNLKPQKLMVELASSGVKYNPDEVIAVTKTADGKSVWLEQGNEKAGLVHIMRHKEQFASKGISSDNIPFFLLEAIKNGKIVGIQRSRPIYEILYEGELQRVAISIGENGFVIGANPKSIR